MSGNYGRLKPSTKRHNAGICMAYGCTKDNNTYCYRMTNGHKHLHRIILGRGWEHTPFDITKLSCYEGKKGEESMKGRKAKEKPSNAELMAFAKKWHYINLTGRAKTEYHVGYDTAKKWLTEAGLLAKQTSEPEQAANQEPAQDATEPAKAIILNTSPIDPADFYTEQAYIKAQPGDLNYTPTDNDYNEEPQRTTITRAQYDEMAGMNDDRRDALGIYCEQQAVESMIQGWAADIFKHSTLSIEKKLELTRQLLEWEVGA